MTEYPVERAIADAILYHDNCSLVAGLEQAALSIERAANPGMEQLIKFKKMEKVLREIDDKKDKGIAAPAVPPAPVAPVSPPVPAAPALPRAPVLPQ